MVGASLQSEIDISWLSRGDPKMFDRDPVAILIEQVPEEVITLRDGIANAEPHLPGELWERQREISARIKELKAKCAEAGHSLLIALSGRPGTRRRLLRNGHEERRACVMCGTEETGVVVTVFLTRFLLRKARWKFERLNGQVTRTFTDPEWYFETVSVFRQFSFSTEVVLYHAFPPRLPISLLAGHGAK